MSDILIRDVSEATVAELDRRAAAQGISRAELLRRYLEADFPAAEPVGADDWSRFGAATADLADPDVMADAWR